MRVLFKIIIVGLCIIASFKGFSQTPQFAHFYNNALLYNPAFTGNVDLGRFALSYRNQWPSIPGKFVSYAASYEHYFNNLSSGMGIQFVQDEAGSGGLTSSIVNFSYSYQMQLSRKLALMAGLKAGTHSRFYDFSSFTFADQIANSPDGVDGATNETGFRERINFGNFGTGVVFYHLEKYWAGIAVDHLNRPNNSFSEFESRLPMFINVQGGYNIDAEDLGGKRGSVLTIAGLYKAQQKWDQLDIGLYYKTEPYLLGLWYRGLPLKTNESSIPNYDAIMLMGGLRFDRISFAYSYEVTLSPLAGNTGGSHEISLILEYPKSKRRPRRFSRVPCPKF